MSRSPSDPFGKFERVDSVQNVAVNFELIAGARRERRLAGQNLKDKTPERPQIGGEVVSRIEQNFGTDVLWRPAKRPGLRLVANLLGEAEIDELYIAYNACIDGEYEVNN